MSLTLKIFSLSVRTLAKPIANSIKRRARDHEVFRKYCVNLAQRLHRLDMRLRLGLLQDPAAIDRQIAKEVAEAEAKRKNADIPTVKTEAQMKADEQAAARAKDELTEKAKAAHKPRRIRPLTEAKAIETGANFISEAFIFSVGISLLLAERWYSRRKESNRREGVADRLEELEAKIAELQQELLLKEPGSQSVVGSAKQASNVLAQGQQAPKENPSSSTRLKNVFRFGGRKSENVSTLSETKKPPEDLKPSESNVQKARPEAT